MGASSSRDYEYVLERRTVGAKRNRDSRASPSTYDDRHIEKVYGSPSPLSHEKPKVNSRRGRGDYAFMATPHHPHTRSRSYTRKRSNATRFPADHPCKPLSQGFHYTAQSSGRSSFDDAEAANPRMVYSVSERVPTESRSGGKRGRTHSSTHSRKSRTANKTSTHRAYR